MFVDGSCYVVSSYLNGRFGRQSQSTPVLAGGGGVFLCPYMDPLSFPMTAKGFAPKSLATTGPPLMNPNSLPWYFSDCA